MSVFSRTDNASNNAHSATDAKSTIATGHGGTRILHFDATLVRKNKMREKALAQGRGQGNQPETVRPAMLAQNETNPPTTSENHYGHDLGNELDHGNGHGNGHAPFRPHAQALPSEANERVHVTPNVSTETPSRVTLPAADSTPINANAQNPKGDLPTKKSGPPAEQLEQFLINFVVEQTGYPEEIVELDADLEADLGVDSIKKAQLFGELREYFEIIPTEDMTLDDFPTLRDVLHFLRRNQEPTASPHHLSQSPTDDAMPNHEPTNHEPANLVLELTPRSTPSITTTASTDNTLNEPANAKSVPPIDQLEPFLINFVVEQTGYPAEIVEMDADLEADLGIDSIKKAQLFGELREYFEITPSDDLTLDDFATLRDVMNFLQGTRPTQEPALTVDQEDPVDVPQAAPAVVSDPAFATTSVSAKTPAVDQLEPFLINFVVEQTGYPAEIVEMDADLEADLGIDSIKKAQLFGELREYFEVTPTDDLTLDDFATLRDIMNFLQGTHPKQQSTETGETGTPNESTPIQSEITSVNDPSACPTDKAPPPEQLESFLINFVVEQTGYPAEIVEMDADLEADLGIDSIKKAQLFGELREYFEITPTNDMTLDDFATLRDVMEFLQGTHLQSKSTTEAMMTSVATSSSPTLADQENGKPGIQDAQAILLKISQILKDRNMVAAAKANLTNNTRLIEDVGLDSVGMLDLITAVEKHFNITISLEDLEIESLNQSGLFANMVARKLAEKP